MEDLLGPLQPLDAQPVGVARLLEHRTRQMRPPDRAAGGPLGIDYALVEIEPQVEQRARHPLGPDAPVGLELLERAKQRRVVVIDPVAEDVQVLARDGFLVGSHGIDHEDFGRLAPTTAERVLAESRRLIGEVTGREPEHFSFPFGQRGVNITAESYALAEKHYRYVYSAYGGYNFPSPGQRHFLRICSPIDVMSLAMIMDGYTGFRACLTGDAWGWSTRELAPF